MDGWYYYSVSHTHLVVVFLTGLRREEHRATVTLQPAALVDLGVDVPPSGHVLDHPPRGRTAAGSLLAVPTVDVLLQTLPTAVSRLPRADVAGADVHDGVHLLVDVLHRAVQQAEELRLRQWGRPLRTVDQRLVGDAKAIIEAVCRLKVDVQLIGVTGAGKAPLAEKDVVGHGGQLGVVLGEESSV